MDDIWPLIILFIVQEMKAQAREVTWPWQNECPKRDKARVIRFSVVSLLPAVAVDFTHQLKFWKCESNLLIKNRKLWVLTATMKWKLSQHFKNNNKNPHTDDLSVKKKKKERWRNFSVVRNMKLCCISPSVNAQPVSTGKCEMNDLGNIPA